MTSPCWDSVRRASMTDDEFWADVYPSNYDHEPDDDTPDPVSVTATDAPCPVCGCTGPCAYDPAGLPLAHIPEDTA